MMPLSSLPVIYAGAGEERVQMYRGNFRIEDDLTLRRCLTVTDSQPTDRGIRYQLDDAMTMEIQETAHGDVTIFDFFFVQLNPSINRFWIRIPADPDELDYGLGEQMSYFNLRGRHFPVWTSEPGVGRDKTTYVTWRSDVENGGAGGDYYTTNYPQPTFVSSRHYYLHVDTTAYADFDFRHEDFHEIEVWEVLKRIRIVTAPDFKKLLWQMHEDFGYQKMLPDWIYDGLVLGVQGGRSRSLKILNKVQQAGIKVSALWCQDWSGSRVTSFGKRLQWDWQYDEKLYPDLPGMIRELHAQGIRFLAYANPYLVQDGELFQEGLKEHVFARRKDGSVYLVDFGEFSCGVIDLTDAHAEAWFRKRILKENMLDIGIDGWMADFGEYLPTDDIVLSNGVSPMIEHNLWPVRWAKCNFDAVRDCGREADTVFFMRAGGTGSQKYCQLLWAGDQSVDFSRHDGLCTVICAALSAGMSGCGLTHSDIGGYTSLFGNVRTKELFLRWAEMAVFTPCMRTHEGNRPEENYQFYDDADAMQQMARLVDIFMMLKPYLKACDRANAKKGLPVERPMFLYDEMDPACYDLQFQYMLGEDLIVAPVWQQGVKEQSLYLPQGCWVHLWSGKVCHKGEIAVAAEIGYIPVFYRQDSPYAGLFEQICLRYGYQEV